MQAPDAAPVPRHAIGGKQGARRVHGTPRRRLPDNGGGLALLQRIACRGQSLGGLRLPRAPGISRICAAHGGGTPGYRRAGTGSARQCGNGSISRRGARRGAPRREFLPHREPKRSSHAPHFVPRAHRHHSASSEPCRDARCVNRRPLSRPLGAGFGAVGKNRGARRGHLPPHACRTGANGFFQPRKGATLRLRRAHDSRIA